MLRPNTAIEDVAAVIGFNATACLIQWHGGRNIYIPDKPTPSHPLAGLLGLVALATHLGLADGFAGGGNAGLDGWRSIWSRHQPAPLCPSDCRRVAPCQRGSITDG